MIGPSPSLTDGAPKKYLLKVPTVWWVESHMHAHASQQGERRRVGDLAVNQSCTENLETLAVNKVTVLMQTQRGINDMAMDATVRSVPSFCRPRWLCPIQASTPHRTTTHLF